MKRIYLPLILFFLVIFEGVAINLLPTSIALSDYLIIAHWVLVFLIYIAIYYDTESTYYSVVYAFIFGLLIDIIYTEVLGVYMFSYGLTIYIIHGLQRLLQRNIFVLILLGILGLMIAELSIYTIYYVVNITGMIWQDYLLQRLLPSIAANLIFLLILYPLFKKKMVHWGNEQLSNDS
ncbi:rod shape-determining protein MreD [Oceanobacillus sp. CAU 1775]